ncbi:fumarylacetoacetate hydrolase family protein [Microbacterium aoyamense]|uniref:Fumarylacetoacetate hydrolase family protein n=1 Tax=Microbacterium aoyamense TaxID=344166 RepID=A0ABP5B894_9MICO|nr:fumarylacetoacetate hydrolase family protein [Microbacterium aoyamense]
MKIGRWSVAGGESSDGFIVDGAVIAFADGLTVADVLQRGLDALPALWAASRKEPKTTLEDVILLSPLSPAAIRDFVAFEEHVEGVTAAIDGTSAVPPEWYEAPTFYFTNPHTVLGPNEPVVPPETERLDFELEVAAIVGGAGGTDLSIADAAGAIFGYTIMNDWSARDVQGREMNVRLGPAKGKDFGTSLGPWIVTRDELEPFTDDEGFLSIRAEARVNGVLVGADLVSNMGWRFADLVAYASRASRVVAGDVLGSGTVGNGGCLAELWGRRGELDPAPLTAGDVVSLSVEGIGDLVSRVEAPVAAVPIAPARPRTRARHR